ncbi:19713_t:CDS:2, partial [Funneliformis geosporum]
TGDTIQIRSNEKSKRRRSDYPSDRSDGTWNIGSIGIPNPCSLHDFKIARFGTFYNRTIQDSTSIMTAFPYAQSRS